MNPKGSAPKPPGGRPHGNRGKARVNRRWRPEEDRFIRANRQMRARQLAEALGRTEASVKQRRRQLDAPSLFAPPWTREEDEHLLRCAGRRARDVARELGRSEYSVLIRRAVLRRDPDPPRKPSHRPGPDGVTEIARVVRVKPVSAPEPAKAMARRMGLGIRVYSYPPASRWQKHLVLWMVRRDGEELGSWVPRTKSARVGPDLHAGVETYRDALRLFGKLVKGRQR